MKRNERLVFGEFEFDPIRSLLFRAGVPLGLGRRASALLAFMLKHRGEVLTKADLIDAAWPALSVEEANLSVQVSQLRDLIGDDWIVTLPRVGYRFRAVTETRLDRPMMPTLAISSFADLDTGQRAEAAGFVEDLGTALARFRSLAVIAGDAPAPSYLVDGSTRRIAGRLRVNVRLTETESGARVWAEIADLDEPHRHAADGVVRLFAGRIDTAVQRAETERSRAQRRSSERPYDLYLRARWHLRSSEERDNAIAYGLLQQALEAAPENIHILAATVETLHHRDSVGWPSISANDRSEAHDLALRGLALGDDDAAAIGLFGEALFSAGEFEAGRLTMERAVEINPNCSLALVCAGLGSLWLVDNDRADNYHQRALAFGASDTNQRFAFNGLSAVQRRRGNYEEAADLARRALAASPSLSAAHWNLIAATVCLGHLDDARRYVERYRAISPSATIASISRGQRIVDDRARNALLGPLAEAGMPEA